MTGARERKEGIFVESIRSIPEVVGERVGTAAARPLLVFRSPFAHNLVKVDSTFLSGVERRSTAAAKVVCRGALGIDTLGMRG